MRIAVVLLLLAGIMPAEEFPTLSQVPKLKTRITVSPVVPGDPFTGEANVVHNYPAAHQRDPMRDWKFWSGSAVAFGAMAYDWHQTVSYKGTACIEKNIEDNPHPGYGALAKKDLPIQLGLFGFKYVLAKYAKVPWWSYSTTDGIAAAIHIHSGMEWNNCH